jgi:hypothetical protein
MSLAPILFILLLADGPAPPTAQPPAPTGATVASEADRHERYRDAERLRRGPDARRSDLLRRERLQPVDAGIEDRSTLDASLRLTQPDLQSMPLGFARVYIDPLDPTRYIRANGALHAVFSQSEYRRGKKGVIPLVPQGTTFRIGTPERFERPIEPFEGAARERFDGRMSDARQGDSMRNARIDRFIGEHADASDAEEIPSPADRRPSGNAIARDERRDEGLLAPQTVDTPLPTMLTSEHYRRQFFTSLRNPTRTRDGR